MSKQPEAVHLTVRTIQNSRHSAMGIKTVVSIS
jgi:hypothetical protein